jgi:hypothetical protein
MGVQFCLAWWTSRKQAQPLEKQSKFEVTLRLTVSQYVLVSSTLVGLATRYYFLSECCCLKFAVFFLWGALSDERTSLQFVVQSLNGPSRSEPVTIFYCHIWDSPNLEGQVPGLIQNMRKTRAHRSQYEVYNLQEPDAVLIGTSVPTFHNSLLPIL